MGSVLVVDDHVLVRSTLVMALESEGHDAYGVPTASASVILAEASRHRSGLVLLDLDLAEGPNGADLVVPLRSLGWSVLVVTGSRDRKALAAAIYRGAVGWVSKTSSFEELLLVVLSAAAGEEVLAPAMREELVRLHQRLHGHRCEVTERLSRLSTREREVLDQLVAGRGASAIAVGAMVSMSTVRAQIRAILAKLEVRTQLAAVAMVNEARHPDTDDWPSA
ncbi:MAG: response regulator transcription factor [Umezawaea sp.]